MSGKKSRSRYKSCYLLCKTFCGNLLLLHMICLLVSKKLSTRKRVYTALETPSGAQFLIGAVRKFLTILTLVKNKLIHAKYVA